MSRRVFFLIFAVGVALRVYYINVPPLWYDENYTLILARLPFDDMMAAVMGDVHPPLWYMLEWSIFHLAPDAPAWVIRVPALVFSVGSLPLFVMVMRQMGIKPQVQSVAFACMAVLPFQLWYAQEGRMYALLGFLVLLTLWAGITRQYVLLFVGSLLMLYTQNYGPFYMASIAVVLWVYNRRVVFDWQMGAMMAAGVLWLPWVRVIVSQASGINDRYWIVAQNIGSVFTILYKLFFTASVPSDLFFASYAVVYAALIIGVISLVRSSHPARLAVAVMAFAPLLMAWAVTMAWQPVLLFRALIGSAQFLYLIVAWSFDVETEPEKHLTSVRL